MRIHTDVMSYTQINGALSTAGFGNEVFVQDFSEHGSRSRRYAYEVRLGADPGRDRNGKARRPRATGRWGSDSTDSVKAATYDEHGYWIAALFDYDPKAIVGPYKGRAHFHESTRGRYATEVSRSGGTTRPALRVV